MTEVQQQGQVESIKRNGLSPANEKEESNEEAESAARNKFLQAGRTNIYWALFLCPSAILGSPGMNFAVQILQQRPSAVIFAKCYMEHLINKLDADGRGNGEA